MALILADRVKETTITTGTGSITLGGAFGGFQTFSAAIGDGNTTYYVLENDTRFEVGIGVYDAASNTLSRDTILKSSSGGSKISLSGLTTVFCNYPSDKAVFLDLDDRLSLKDTNISLSGINAANINSDGDVGISGLLTLRRTSAGNFFHAYVDDSNDRTISLYHDGTVSPDWRIGLKNSPSDSGAAPSYAYLYAGDGSIGLYSNSDNNINLTHGGGFNIVNKGNTIFTAYSTTGVAVNSFSTTYPSFVVKSTAGQSSDLQRWVDSSETVLAKVASDGDLTAHDITATGDLFVGSTNVITHIAANSASGVAISGWAEQYIDSKDHSGLETSGTLQPQITKNASDILVVSGLTQAGADFMPHASGDYFLTEIRANSASGSVNAADILVVSGIADAAGLPEASGGAITANTNLIHSSGNFLLNEISASGAAVSGLANTAVTAVSGYAQGYTDLKITDLIDGAPAALDTLNEIADALDDDANLAGTLTTLINNNTTSIDNLNIFDEVRVAGQDNIVASTHSDILTFAAGTNITLTTSASTDTITIDAADSDERVYASGDFLLQEIRANSASGLSNQTALNASGVAISGYAEAIAGQGGLPFASGDFFLGEITSNSASGASISGYFEHRADLNSDDIIVVSGLIGDSSVSGIQFSVSGSNDEFRLGTTFFDADGTEQVVRASDFHGGFLRLEVARFSPSVSAAGQSRSWDQPVSQWTVTVDNPTDFTTNYVSGVKSPLTGITGSVTSDVTLYSTSGPSVTPGGGVDWTQTFSTDGDSPIYSSTNDLTGGSASATVSFLDKNQATISETATISFNWSTASNAISFGNLSGKNFLETYTSTTYNLTINNISDLSNTSTTITSSQGSLSNSSDDGTITFTTAIHKDNNSGRTITATTDFTRPATVTGTEYTVQDVSSDSSISATFTYPSFYIFTASTSNVPSRADVVDTNDFDSSTVTELGNQVKVIDQYINNPDGVPKCWWFGVRSSASQPTSFETGSGPSLLVSASPTEATVDLEPDSPPAGYNSEEYKLYGITLNPGNTYVKIS